MKKLIIIAIVVLGFIAFCSAGKAFENFAADCSNSGGMMGSAYNANK